MDAVKAKAESDSKKIQQLELELAAARSENKELRTLSNSASFDGRERAALNELLEKESDEKRELLSRVASLQLKIDQLQEEKVGSNNFEDLMVEKFNYLAKEKELLQLRLRDREELHGAQLAEQTQTIEQLRRDSQQLRQNCEMLRMHAARVQSASNEAVDQLAERLNSQFRVALPVPASIGMIFSGLDTIAMKLRDLEQDKPSDPRWSVQSIRSSVAQQQQASRPKPPMDDKLIKEKVMLEIALARNSRDLETLRKKLAACTCAKEF